MARKGSRKSKGRVKPSIVSMIPVAVLAKNAYDGYGRYGVAGAATFTAMSVVPYNPGTKQWDFTHAKPFYASLAGVYVAKKVIAMSGVNRAMKSLPFRL